MAINRRHFLKLTVNGLLLTSPLAWANPRRLREWLSCRRDAAGRYSVCAISEQGEITLDIALPDRGHAVVKYPHRDEIVVLARRPGTFMIVVDLCESADATRIDCPTERHFYGHGVFDAKGRLLYTTENDFEAGKGVIGVYDATDSYRRLGEFASYGIGPHELKFLNDGVTLVIANGGIRTHPDLGRAKLNLAEMQPNLAYVDAGTGRLLDSYRLPKELHQLSIRHIAVTANDKVCIAMQYQGPNGQHPPLVATHQGEETLHLLTAPEPLHTAMRNYCGSVAIDVSGQLFAVTSPRGGLITLWSMIDGQFLGASALPDCCGIAAGDQMGKFLVTNGQGNLVKLTSDNERWTQTSVRAEPASSWDNHLTA